jgi:DNA-binding NarL/FixJ family response regulator
MKVLVVDDHPLVRDALRVHLQRLEDGVDVVEARTGAEVLDLAEQHPDADLVLLDLNLPDIRGFSVLASLRERHPAIPVVVLSANQDQNSVLEALDRGAMGFIPKTASTDVMLSALRLVLAGGVYLPADVLTTRFSQAGMEGSELPSRPTAARAQTPAAIGLTERQAQVLSLMVQGKPNKLICRELGLAESTVKIHITAILRALKADNRTQAVIAVSRLGLQLDDVGPAVKIP